MSKNISIKKIVISVAVILLLVILDQFTKALAQSALQYKENLVLIPGVLELTYLENTGAAFSFMATKGIFQIIMTIITPIVLLLVLYYLIRSFQFDDQKRYKWLQIVMVFLFAGALGNFIDRILNHYVIDFIYFSLINFPVFNVADIYVTCTVILLFVLLLFYYKEDELSRFFHLGKK